MRLRMRQLLTGGRAAPTANFKRARTGRTDSHDTSERTSKTEIVWKFCSFFKINSIRMTRFFTFYVDVLLVWNINSPHLMMCIV